MIIKTDTHLIQLCKEYIEYVDAMRGGIYDAEETTRIGGQRSIVHDELCRYTNQDRSIDMYVYAKNVLGILPESEDKFDPDNLYH